ncbi:MAG: hypothetical protein WC717_00315 [Candidatus Micrarchaeia archaeon]
MGKLSAAAAVASFLFLFGCAQGGPAGQAASAANGSFILPQSAVSYHARYAVEEGGPMAKEVWRAGDDMRIDLLVQGKQALSFYFTGGRAYSCSHLSAPPACYDMGARFSQGDAGRLVPSEKDVAGATKAESVKIGSTTGECYDVYAGALGSRKLCFAPHGVVAYDSYNVSKTMVHTEYLTGIEYYGNGEGIDGGVFALPSAPVFAPSG